MYTRPLSFFLWWLLVFTAICTTTSDITPACPEQCLCTTTEEGLHKAVCTSLSSLHKYSIRNKLHNINIINLHGAGVVKINNELDRFNEVVSLDLSDNKIEHLNKLLRTSKKLTHVNLSKNYLKKFSASVLPPSVSSLDLTNNRLEDVPSSLQTLANLEHLLLRGNPLECSCHNLKILEHISEHGVVLDDVRCINRPYHKSQSWKEFKVADVCSEKKRLDGNKHIDLDDMMMGDQPSDTEMIADETSDRKSMPMTDSRDLNAGEVFESSGASSNDADDEMFINVQKNNTIIHHTYEGSGDVDLFNAGSTDKLGKMVNTEMTPTTEEPEGSGDVPLFVPVDREILLDEDYEGSGDDEQNTTTTTEPFIMGPFNPFFSSEHSVTSTDETFETPEAPTVFMGKIDWDAPDPEPLTTTMKAIVEEEIGKQHRVLDTAPVEIPDSKDNLMSEDMQEPKPAKSSVGTYVCIGIMLFILLALVGIVIIKNAIRKRRNKRYIRQQKKDVEKAGKEMVDMNKSLLGKPLTVPNEPAKIQNGNYELVATHEPTKKNGTLDSRKSVEDEPVVPKMDVPKETSPNPNNNVPAYPTNGHSHPQDIPDSTPYINGHSSPQLNGRHYPESNLLGPPNEYIPVYDPDSGRVRIKMTETPKPKTPVLITRSRSNAGDIIITPVSEPSSPVKNST